MHTPDQARELWCPMVRIARREFTDPERAHATYPEPDVIVGGCNTDALGRVRVPHSCKCIADQCAMWRWGEWIDSRRDEVQEHAPDASGKTRRVVCVPFKIPAKGYCGLAGPAGRPELTK